MTPPHPQEPVVDEKLIEGAPVQWQLSREHCAPSCAWYHGPRQYLRALGVLRGSSKDSRFMLESLGRCATTGRVSRVLISGAADCGILAHVVAAYGSAVAPVHVTLVDRCRTPLLANEWFASSSGVPLVTHESDILTFQPAAAFDVICAHSFLGGFDADGRRAVARRWHEWLRPGGVVVAVSPVFVGRTEAHVGPDESQAQRIRAAAARVGDDDCQRLGVTRTAVVAWAEAQIQRRVRHLLRSTEELFGPFQDAGFRVVQGGVEAPADGATAVRARIVLEREPRPRDFSFGTPV